MTQSDIIVSLQTHSPKYDYGNLDIIPKGIVVHSTGANNPNLKRYVYAPEELGENVYENWFGGPNSNYVVPHGAIGKDKNGKVRVAQILPYTKACQCAGKGRLGSYNYNNGEGYIQFEIAEDGLNDEKYFNEAFNVAADYCAFLMKMFPTIEIENIVSHKEAHDRGYASGHVDPENWMPNFGKDMSWFRDLVKEKLESNNETRYHIEIGTFKDKVTAEAVATALKDIKIISE